MQSCDVQLNLWIWWRKQVIFTSGNMEVQAGLTNHLQFRITFTWIYIYIHIYIYHIYIYIYIYITIHFNIYWLYIYTYTNIVLVQTYQIPPLANLSFAPASLDHGIPSGWLLCAWPLPLSPNCAGFLVAICQGRHGIGLQVGAGPMTWYHPRPSAITHSRFLFLSLD